MKWLSKFSIVWAAPMAFIFGPGAAADKTPKAGDPAPLIEGTDESANRWKLSDRIGKRLVLFYFYPKDNTPGCTREACSLRDRMADLNRDNVEVVGVSFDSPEAHRKFIANYKLNFHLLSDSDGRISDAWGARARIGFDLNRRISFLVGLDGRIVHVTDTPSPEAHLNEMRDAIGRGVKPGAAE